MSKHRNAGLTPFQTVTIFSQKCQRFRFKRPFTSMIAGMTGPLRNDLGSILKKRYLVSDFIASVF